MVNARIRRLSLLPWLRSWGWASLLLALGACASSEPVRFYGLSAADAASAARVAPAAAGATVVLERLRFPDYLDRPQIVTRSGANTFEIAEFDRWAEPLDVAFQRALAVTLEGLLPEHVVVGQRLGRIDAGYRIGGEVLRFDADASGRAVLDVRWTLEVADGRAIEVHASHLTDRAERPGDYASMAAALGRTLEAFAREVRDRILAARDG